MTDQPVARGAPLELYDSLTRALVPFRPLDPRLVRLYSCGPTVYHYAHLGNLRAYVFTDTLRRVLNWKGYATNHVINITDVGHLTSDADVGEDKMEAAATGSGRDIWQVAAFYTDAFKADLARLNVLPPTLWSVATDHVQDMIAFACVIEGHGAAYELPSGLYFDVTKVPDYGRLARAATDEGAARIDPVEGKRHPADFALWRRSPDGATRQMEWASPWGPGAPGWHLECSVMSLKYLGPQFDIHTGGIDHREIHHPNEIAQNQAYGCTASTGATIWMHNNFLVDRGAKMSKSSGEFLTLSRLVEGGIHPLAYRLLCLSAHYRSELEFSDEIVLAALARLRRMYQAVDGRRFALAFKNNTFDLPWYSGLAEAVPFYHLGPLLEQAPDLAHWAVRRFSRGASFEWAIDMAIRGLSSGALTYLERFDAAVSKDLNTAVGLTVLDEALVDRALSDDEALRVAAVMDLTLGFDLVRFYAKSLENVADSKTFIAERRREMRVRPVAATLIASDVESRREERRAARAAKDFGRSDAIRAELAEANVEVMDGDPLGWDWRPTFGRA